MWPLAAALAFAGPTDDAYRLGPDSEPHAGVPQGKVVGPIVLTSTVYPETTRNYWVYVPAQYDPSRPACLMVFQDGHAFLGPKGDWLMGSDWEQPFPRAYSEIHA